MAIYRKRKRERESEREREYHPLPLWLVGCATEGKKVWGAWSKLENVLLSVIAGVVSVQVSNLF